MEIMMKGSGYREECEQGDGMVFARWILGDGVKVHVYHYFEDGETGPLNML